MDEKGLHKMTPDHALNFGNFLFERNRHSPRILNKNAKKLDISTVNTKLDFMKSLNLYCTVNSKESYSKINWDVLLPRNSFPLKECSVVIDVVKCNVCVQSTNNQIDVEHHKNLHNRLTGLIDNGYASGDDSAKESNERENIQESCVKYDDNNYNLNSMSKIKTNKKHTHKRRKRNKNGVTKVTLKIGSEVISRVYCKKKYLNNVCHNSCNEIKPVFRDNKVNTVGISHVPMFYAKSSIPESSDCNAARLRKMAEALVEFELRQKAHHVLEGSDLFSSDEYIEIKEDEGDAVVPISNGSIFDSNDRDDDILEILQSTTNTHESDINDVTHESEAHSEREKLTTMKNYEVITIDDEGCDLEDDCIIVEERLSDKSLRDVEHSYVFDIINKDELKEDALNVKRTYFSTERVSINNLLKDNQSIVKKRKSENKFYSRTIRSENLEVHKIQKENKNCESSIVKLSQFALPLRLINF